MKSIFAIALTAATGVAQSIDARAAALQGSCCGPNNLSCACTEDQLVHEIKKNCVEKTIFRENVKLVMQEVNETKTREIQKTVMVPYTEMVKQIKTVQKPVKRMEQRQRVDHRLSTEVSWMEVSEEVRVPIPRPDCACYSTSCGCVGQEGCSCCQPKCGCAPPRVQYATQIVKKMVPKGEKVKTPVMVPYQEEVTVMEDEHILHEVPVTKMMPKIVLETIEEIIPVYKEVPVVTKVPVVIEECTDVLVEEGVRPVVKHLTFEEVHQTHEDGDEIHNHSGYSRSSDVAYPANPNMHSHAIRTNGLAFHVPADGEVFVKAGSGSN